MIQDWMRENRRTILVATLALIIVPFVMWGGGFGRALRGRDDQDMSSPIALVGDTPITRQRYRYGLDEEIARRARLGATATYKDLAFDGTAERILDGLIKSILLTREAEGTGLGFSRDYLAEQLREDPAFKNDTGEFDVELWNAWIDREQDWNAVYANVSGARRLYMLERRVIAPARVLDANLRRQFEKDYTELQVKFVSIEPPIEPTEEEVRAQYDEDPSRYELPEKRKAEFLAISLAPPRPAAVDELVQQARAGEDFAELAAGHSGSSTKEEGGDIGWVNLAGPLPAHRKVLAELGVNEVSDPVAGPGGYYVFKVEEERADEESGERQVRAREIFMRAALGIEEREAREQQAEQLAAAAKETGDLRTVTEASGLAVQTSGPFSVNSTTIENLPDRDVFMFRSALTNLGEDEFPEVIQGFQNFYVAKVIEVMPPESRSFEDAREEVREDTVEAIRQGAEYKGKVEALAEKIASEAHSLGEIEELYPELQVSIRETLPFSQRKPDYASGLMCSPRDVLDALGEVEPGTLGGPIRGFLGQEFFVELIKKTPPDDAVWEEQWPEELETRRRTALALEQREQFEDYLHYLYERSRGAGLILSDHDAIAAVVGLDEQPPAPEEKIPADTDEETADAPVVTPPPETESHADTAATTE